MGSSRDAGVLRREGNLLRAEGQANGQEGRKGLLPGRARLIVVVMQCLCLRCRSGKQVPGRSRRNLSRGGAP